MTDVLRTLVIVSFMRSQSVGHRVREFTWPEQVKVERGGGE